jgi:hypothetical protein
VASVLHTHGPSLCLHPHVLPIAPSSHALHGLIIVHPLWPHLYTYPSWPHLHTPLWPLLACPSLLTPCGPIFVCPSWLHLRMPLMASPLWHIWGSSVPRDKLIMPKPVSAPCSSLYYVSDQSPQSHPHGDNLLLETAVPPSTMILQSMLHDILDLCDPPNFVTKLDPLVQVYYGHS